MLSDDERKARLHELERLRPGGHYDLRQEDLENIQWLLSEVERLEGELNGAADAYAARCKFARADLRKYGSHIDPCEYSDDVPCICGYSEALADAE